MSHHCVLDDLGKLCEHSASKLVAMDNIGKFMLLCSRYESQQLRSACKRFVADHGRQLKEDKDFRKEIENFPELGLLILDASTEDEESGKSQGSSKRRRITESSDHDMVPQGSDGSNTIGANGGEQTW